MKALHVTPGMTIIGRDRAEVGTAKEVWVQTESHGYLPVSRYLMRDYGPIRGTSSLLGKEEGFVQIGQGNPFSGRSQDLWVPLRDVMEVRAQRTATLERASGTYREDYAGRPGHLEHAA